VKRANGATLALSVCLYLQQTPAPLDPRSSRSAAAPERSHYCSYWEPQLAQRLSDKSKNVQPDGFVGKTEKHGHEEHHK